MLLAPLLRQFAFNRCFEHGLAVAFELPFRCLQRRDSNVQLGEQLFDLGGDALLLFIGGDQKLKLLNVTLEQMRRCTSSNSLFYNSLHCRTFEEVKEKFRDKHACTSDYQ